MKLIGMKDVMRIYGVGRTRVRAIENAGQLRAVRNPRNHRLFLEHEVRALAKRRDDAKRARAGEELVRAMYFWYVSLLSSR